MGLYTGRRGGTYKRGNNKINYIRGFTVYKETMGDGVEIWHFGENSRFWQYFLVSTLSLPSFFMFLTNLSFRLQNPYPHYLHIN